MTSEGMPLLPDAFPQARELIALRNKSTEGGRSSWQEAGSLNYCVNDDVLFRVGSW